MDSFPGQLEGQQDSRRVQSALPLSFTNLACQLGFITSSTLSPLPSFVPAANKEDFATSGREARVVDVGKGSLLVQGMDAVFASHGVGARAQRRKPARDF